VLVVVLSGESEIVGRHSYGGVLATTILLHTVVDLYTYWKQSIFVDKSSTSLHE